LTGDTVRDTRPAPPPLVEVSGVSKRFCRDLTRSLRYGLNDIVSEIWPGHESPGELRPGEFWGLRDVSFELRRGEAVAIVGANGSGKSTLLKLLNGLLKPDEGRITVRGRVAAILELGTGFSPVLSGRENVYANAALMGLTTREVDGLFDEIVDFSGLREFIDTPLQFYSSGMAMRLAFSVAVHLKPDVMLLDEVLAVGDLAFQRKCVRHFLRYLDAGGSIVFVGHNPHQSQAVCQRGILLDHGRMLFSGTVTDTLDRYLTLTQDRAARASSGESDDAVVPNETGDRPSGGAHASHQRGALSAEFPVAIDDVSVRSSSGGVLGVDEDAIITLRYRSLADIDPAGAAFMIFTADQWVCITVTLGPTIRLPAGSGELTATLRLPLLPGTYVVRAVIADPASLQPFAMLGWQEAAPLFSITAPPDWRRNVAASLNPLISVEATWDGPVVRDDGRPPAGASAAGVAEGHRR
jgi:ABC-type polysaccharide/polyol phosphate transport system ATPase subunit